MADDIGSSSPVHDTYYEEQQLAESDQLQSLPLSPPSGATGSRKLKKPPPVTPKRFTRFFTPRSLVNEEEIAEFLSESGRQLRDITRSAITNSRNAEQDSKKTVLFADISDDQEENNATATPQTSLRRKRKILPSPESSPVQPSPSKRFRSRSWARQDVQVFDEEAFSDEDSEDEQEDEEDEEECAPIQRLQSTGVAMRLLLRSFGGPRAVGRGRIRDSCIDWQPQTANFYTRPEDTYTYKTAIPFCTARCNSNSLVAIGDEEGGITLLDSARGRPIDFNTAHISFRGHCNAIMDITFSSDDMFLATASGDQTARVTDMHTQEVTYTMCGHLSSVKQVRFQPGNDKVIATSSRDGSVRLWDLRCRGGMRPVHQTQVSFDPDAGQKDSVPKWISAGVYNVIPAAHAERQWLPASLTALNSAASQSSSKSESTGRRGDVSVTAISFMPHGREHLLLTASEASTCVKLWDIRGRHTRRGGAVPISTTRQPESHDTYRQFGINSLVLNGDGTRLYALSRDSTIYAYSTNHLVLGHAPELTSSASRWPKQGSMGREGLGPLYGFRHSKFHATTFYVKAALRPLANDNVELLAVGSSDGCPVLFPTDETVLRKAIPPEDEDASLDELSCSYDLRSGLTGTRSSRQGTSSRLNDTIPIYECGTALERAHVKEVSSLTWTYGGELVTVSDDFTARCWREGQQAQELRLGGETGGQRWASGWAEALPGVDDEE